MQLTTAQVAEQLGIKPETIYAYVSRGVLQRHRGADGRTSYFDSAEVARLAARGRPRRRAVGDRETSALSGVSSERSAEGQRRAGEGERPDYYDETQCCADRPP